MATCQNNNIVISYVPCQCNYCMEGQISINFHLFSQFLGDFLACLNWPLETKKIISKEKMMSFISTSTEVIISLRNKTKNFRFQLTPNKHKFLAMIEDQYLIQ